LIARARAVLNESIHRSGTPGEEIPIGFNTGRLVAGRLRDWNPMLAVTARQDMSGD
jgi:hypothetical protein